MGIAPTARSIPGIFPDEKVRHFKVQLLQRIIFVLFKRLIQSSCNEVVVGGTTYVPLISMLVADQPEEHTLVFLKRCDSDMDCTYFVLRSTLRTDHLQLQAQLQANSSDDDATRPTRRRASLQNTSAHLALSDGPKRDPTITVRHQLSVFLHNSHRHLNNARQEKARPHLISDSSPVPSPPPPPPPIFRVLPDKDQRSALCTVSCHSTNCTS